MYSSMVYFETYTAHDTTHVAELPTSAVNTLFIEIRSAVHTN